MEPLRIDIPIQQALPTFIIEADLHIHGLWRVRLGVWIVRLGIWVMGAPVSCKECSPGEDA